MLVCCPGRVPDNFSIHDDFYSRGKIHSSILPLLKVSRYTTQMIHYYTLCPCPNMRKVHDAVDINAENKQDKFATELLQQEFPE